MGVRASCERSVVVVQASGEQSVATAHSSDKAEQGGADKQAMGGGRGWCRRVLNLASRFKPKTKLIKSKLKSLFSLFL